MIFWGGLAALLVAFLVYAFRPQPVPVDFTLAQRGRLTVTVDEEGETRVRDVFVLSAPVAGRVRRIEIEVGDEVVANETIVAEIEPVDPTLLDVRSESEAPAAVAAAEAELEFASRERAASALGERGSRRADLDAAEGLPHRARQPRERALPCSSARPRVCGRSRRREGAGRRGVRVGIPYTRRCRAACCVLRESAGVVQAGEPLLEIGNPQDLEIVVDLLSADAVRVEPGQEVLIEQWGGGQMLHGRVRRIEPYGFTKVSALGIEEQRVNIMSSSPIRPRSGNASATAIASRRASCCGAATTS
jgi:HlyD family secretion protein